jgi:hypothetical protein
MLMCCRSQGWAAPLLAHRVSCWFAPERPLGGPCERCCCWAEAVSDRSTIAPTDVGVLGHGHPPHGNAATDGMKSAPSASIFAMKRLALYDTYTPRDNLHWRWCLVGKQNCEVHDKGNERDPHHGCPYG